MSAAIGVICVLAVGLLGREIWGWLPAVTRLIIRVVTRLLPEKPRAIRREEWLAEYAAEFDERRVSGLIWAGSLGAICVWERLVDAYGRRRSSIVRGVKLGGYAAAVVVPLTLFATGHVLLAVLFLVCLALPVVTAFGLFGLLHFGLWQLERQEEREDAAEWERIQAMSHEEFLALSESLRDWFPGGRRRGWLDRLAALPESQRDTDSTRVGVWQIRRDAFPADVEHGPRPLATEEPG